MENIIYIMIVKNIGDDDSKSWKEEMNVNTHLSIEDHAKAIINSFNNSLRPFEKPRELVSAKELSDLGTVTVELKHDWGKKSLVTQKGGYDVMQCKICGALGKRYGLGPSVKTDYKFRKHEFICPGKRLKNA